MTQQLLPLRTKFEKAEWYIRPVNVEPARKMVEQQHYAHGAAPGAVYCHGLFLHGDSLTLYGVAWWIPAAKGTVDKYNPHGYSTTLTLHRLVIHPLVPTNGASFLLGRSIRAIKQDGRYELLVTYADTWQHHTGAIYKATNWDYRGLTDGTQVWVTAEGKVIGRRGARYGKGKNRLNGDLTAMGCVFEGRHAKHVFTLKLAVKAQSSTLAMFEVQYD